MIKRESGFTLIEIMVALLIMAGLSLIMAQSVKSGLESRKKVQLQITEESLIRDAMRLMKSDVGAAFHHRDFTVSTYNKVLELRKKKAATPQAGTPGQINPGAPSQQNPAAPGAGQLSGGAAPATTVAPDPLASATPLPVPAELTGFTGSSEAMTFSVRNHVRRFIDAKESDQARVSYFLRTCRGEGKKAGTSFSSQCLMRLEVSNPTDEFPLSPSNDGDDKAVVLVHNVTAFKLRYLAAGTTEFVDDWSSSSKASSSATKDKFPDAVEISLSIHDTNNPESKPRALTWLAPIRSSNNMTDAEKDAEAKANGTPSPGGARTTTPTDSTTGRQQ